MTARVLVSLACVTALLAGCTGQPATPSFVPTSNVTLSRNSVTLSRNSVTLSLSKGDSNLKHIIANLTIHIRIPHRRRRADYISSATKGMTFAFTGPTKLSTSIGVTPSSRGCSSTSGATICTFALRLATGSYTGTISAFDKAPVSGRIPSSANLLSTAKNQPFKIVAYETNNLSFALDGAIASLSVSGLPNTTVGTPFASPKAFTVTAKDASGETIVGTYDSAVALSTSDNTNAAVSTSGSDNPPAGELLSSSDTAALNYTGAAIASATISASATGATSGHATFAPATPPAPSLTKLSLLGVSSGASGVAITLTGTNFSALGSSVSVTGSGVTFGSIAVNSPTSISTSVSVSGGTPFGTVNVTVTTPGGTTNVEPLTVTTGATFTVNRFDDTAAGATPGTCPAGVGAGSSGDLRFALCNAQANPGGLIQFSCTSPPCTIALSGPLPEIAENLAIDGGTFGNVIIDGASSYRAFYAQSGHVTLANLQIENVKAQGGNGGTGQYTVGGGGGAGLGAGLFIDAAVVSVINAYFLSSAAVGGAGGATTSGAPVQGGGGGGLSGNGGSVPLNGGGGGGGIIGPGADSQATSGGSGGAGFNASAGGTGGADGSIGGNGGNGTYGGGGGGGGNGGGGCVNGSGGIGGFGGGAGGPGLGPCGVTNGSAGGFGGGGSGSNAGGATALGGAGGAGGGGGGGTSAGGLGGTLSLTLSGGNGDAGTNGGGGAAAGPAIFVTTGTLTTTDSGASGASATAGAGGGGSATAGGSDATPVFNYAGTVNGVSVTAGHGGPVASALGSSAPQLRRRSDGRDRQRRP